MSVILHDFIGLSSPKLQFYTPAGMPSFQISGARALLFAASKALHNKIFYRYTVTFEYSQSQKPENVSNPVLMIYHASTAGSHQHESALACEEYYQRILMVSRLPSYHHEAHMSAPMTWVVNWRAICVHRSRGLGVELGLIHYG